MEWLRLLSGIATAAIGSVLSTEFKAWAPRLSETMLRRAVRQLPSNMRERYKEQWSADLAEIPGYLSKLLFAADLNRAGMHIRRDTDRHSGEAEGKSVDLASAPVEAIVEIQSAPTRRRILVADDEPVIADCLAIILNQCGFSAKAVYSGEQAVFEAAAFKPHTVIADTIMCGMSGIETAIQIRSQLPACEILLFSGQAATHDLITQARREGHDFGLIRKPVHPTDLIARLNIGPK